MSQIDPILRALLERMQALETTTKAIHHRMATQHSEIMSSITDLRDTVEKDFATIRAAIAKLDQQIQDLHLSAGALSADDQAAIDQIKSDSAALAAVASTPIPQSPAPAPAPAPAPEPAAPAAA